MPQVLLSEVLIAAGWLAVGIAFALVFVLYRREARGNLTIQESPQERLVNMFVLLQTMRDILDQQKTLARQFNKTVENRVKAIRDVVHALAAQQEQLIQTHRELKAMMAAAKIRLGGPEPAAPRAATGDAATDSRGIPSSFPPLQAVAEPVISGDDLVKSWAGLDFAGDEPDPYAFGVPEQVPETPEDPDTAREAFRKLLNLANERPAADASGRDNAAGAEAEKGNGRNRSETVRALVAEYSDAGMAVPEIARELGLGKGEVRLILSLRSSKTKRTKP